MDSSDERLVRDTMSCIKSGTRGVPGGEVSVLGGGGVPGDGGLWKVPGYSGCLRDWGTEEIGGRLPGGFSGSTCEWGVAWGFRVGRHGWFPLATHVGSLR